MEGRSWKCRCFHGNFARRVNVLRLGIDDYREIRRTQTWTPIVAPEPRPKWAGSGANPTMRRASLTQAQADVLTMENLKERRVAKSMAKRYKVEDGV
ncbi:hypothetical protein VTO73DRAFT_15503 [Trametes versicolor]